TGVRFPSPALPPAIAPSSVYRDSPRRGHLSPWGAWRWTPNLGLDRGRHSGPSKPWSCSCPFARCIRTRRQPPSKRDEASAGFPALSAFPVGLCCDSPQRSRLRSRPCYAVPYVLVTKFHNKKGGVAVGRLIAFATVAGMTMLGLVVATGPVTAVAQAQHNQMPPHYNLTMLG